MLIKILLSASRVQIRLQVISIFSVLLALFFQYPVSSYGGSTDDPSRSTVNGSYMPEGFEDITIGMRQHELLKIRGGRPKPLFGDNVEYPKVLVESIQIPTFYDTVIYGFSDREAILEYVTFTKELKKGSDSKFVERFLESVVRKWGIPVDVEVESQEGVECPVLIWRIGSVRIFVTTTPFGKSQRRPNEQGDFIIVRVMSGSADISSAVNLIKSPRTINKVQIRSDLKPVLEAAKAHGEEFR